MRMNSATVTGPLAAMRRFRRSRAEVMLAPRSTPLKRHPGLDPGSMGQPLGATEKWIPAQGRDDVRSVFRSLCSLVYGRLRLAQHQVEPDQEHRHAQDLAPGDEIVGAETHFRLAEDLTDRTRYCIADHEKARQHSETLANPLLASGPEQEGEQQDAFQPRLIQLAGVARLHVDMRKDDGPGHVGRPANQLAIHEICDPAEEQADRRRSRDQIAEREGTELLAARIQHDRDDHADEPAMERHAALPDLEDLQRIGEAQARLPEQHLPEPAADDDSDCDPEHEIVELGARDALRWKLRQPD